MEDLIIEPFELVLSKLPKLSVYSLVDLVELITLTIPSTELALDVLLGSLELNSPRILIGRPAATKHLVKNLNRIAVDHIEEARKGAKPGKDLLRLTYKEYSGSNTVCEADIRIDSAAKTMFDAVRALHMEPNVCCQISDILLTQSNSRANNRLHLKFEGDKTLNDSQNKALEASLRNPSSIIWGPPGTGKTYTIVAILKRLLKVNDGRVLCTAPTHNAVDNILRRFVIEESDITPLRVSTDVRRVSDDLKKYTCDALVGAEQTSNSAAYRAAQARVKEARIIFSTCIGSGLGLLRPETFQIVLIDEASQQSEAATLIPLVKGCEQAILVGDHVQLRATVQQHSESVQLDISLFERLCTGSERNGMEKILLDTQYRMHHGLCSFSSAEFYENKLRTAVKVSERPSPLSLFHWPMKEYGEDQCRKIFFQLAELEDLGRVSKSNQGQASLCQKICAQLLEKPPTTKESSQSDDRSWSLVILTPYTRQVQLLKRILPSIDVSSINGYQGKEADIVILVTVRCNHRHEIGFLKDMRRLNVALTKAKTGLIVIGDKETLMGSDDATSAATWARLIRSCVTMSGSELMGSNEATAPN